jgi:hypothetical protein
MIINFYEAFWTNKFTFIIYVKRKFLFGYDSYITLHI